MQCAEFSLEIERHSLTVCYYLRIRCRQCGELRVAVSDAPTDMFCPCPSCGAQVRCLVLGIGGTRRAIPFYQPENGFWLDPLDRARMAFNNALR